MLKGTPQGLLLKPGAAPWSAILHSLEQSLQEAGGFFKGGRVILELGRRSLGEETLRALRSLLERHDLELWVVLSEDADVQRLVRSYGLRTRLPGQAMSRPQRKVTAQGNALFLARTLRSGQRVQSAEHVVLLGDVNPGAEVVAGGNIVVWGRAYGTLHAGAFGDVEAVICALDLNPVQLRIGGYIGRPPEERRYRPRPEVAKVVNGIIVVEPWTVRG